jgi:hypothetical protein
VRLGGGMSKDELLSLLPQLARNRLCKISIQRRRCDHRLPELRDCVRRRMRQRRIKNSWRHWRMH